MSLPPFQHVVELHADGVARFLAAQVGPDEADDCLQETLMAALRAYPELRRGSNVRAWLYTIARNKALDSHRARRRRATPVAEPPEAAAPAGADRDGQLWELVRALPEKQRSAVALRYVADLSHREIGVAIGCSEDAARQNVRVGLQKLREELG
jgi:RNA polymerase sigma factor (sigma-70 family)